MKKLTAMILALMLLLTLFSVSAFAAGDAETALAKGIGYWFGTGPDGYSMKKAKAAFQKAADLGSADAWFWLGELAWCGVEEGHMKTALSCYQKAAGLGSGLGLYGLGRLYRNEKRGIKQNFKTARAYFQQAIDAGCLAGYIGMGILYEYGEGVGQDGNKALEFFKKAADAEDWFLRCAARNEIGYLYYHGAKGVEMDYAKALEWVQKAADEGYVNAYSNLGYYIEHPLDSSAPALVKAAKWYRKAAACGKPYNLGVFYINGYGMKKNIKHAIELYKQSADGGRDAVKSLATLASCYLFGKGVTKDKEKAADYANLALVASGEYRGNVKQSNFDVGLAVKILDQLGK